MKKLDFNSGWRFKKAGDETGSTVTLPHDAMLAEKRNPQSPSGSAGAYFEGGSYIYEKTFTAEPEWKNGEVILQFEGVYKKADVFVNGNAAGKICYGYTETEIPIGSFLRFGTENTVRVEVDNTEQPNSRWYSGGGIYRPVWLWTGSRKGIALHGIRIRTVSYSPAVIEADVECGAQSVRISIMDHGKCAASAECADGHFRLEIPEARLWSDEDPYLYECVAEALEDGAVVETVSKTFGIRLIEWSPEGLFINGKETLLRGGCLHHDNGILGACSYKEAEWRRVRILKENGFNAVRSSHNPCAEEVLRACDAYGVYVIDELWDMWYRHKTKMDYADLFPDHYEDDIRSIVRKDYSHPSMILYSVGNEVSEPAEEKGRELEKRMVGLIHSLDSTRPVTAGFNLMIIANAANGQQMYDGEGGLNAGSAGESTGAGQGMPDLSQMNSTAFNQITQRVGVGMNHAADSDEADEAVTPGIDLLDIAGYNYASGRYPLDREKHPQRIIFGSETFPQDIYKNWEMVKAYPNLIGDFMWTAWDYLGEAGIGVWSNSPDAMTFDKPYPWLLGGAGVISILGDPDGQALYAQEVWGLLESPRMAVRPVNVKDSEVFRSVWRGTNAIPAWSYRGCSGRQAIVEVYGKGSFARLYINGEMIGEEKLKDLKAVFDVVYQPGVIEAVTYDGDGRELGRDRLESAAGEISVRIVPEGEAVQGKLLYVNIDICGENGIVERNADEYLEVSAAGAELLGYGSAAPRTEDSYLTGEFRTYYGRSQAVVRPGKVKEIEIKVKKGGQEYTRIIPVGNGDV